MNILVIGRNEVLFDSVLLLAQEHTICGIITSYSAPEYSKHENDFKNLARKFNCPFFISKSITPEIIEFIKGTC